MTAPEPENDRFLPTIPAVAARFGVNPRTVAQWLSMGAPGKADDGTYDADAIRQWHSLNIRSASSGGSADDAELAAWKVRRLIAQAQMAQAKATLAEHKAEKTTGDVVHLYQVEQFLDGLSAEFSRQIASIPERMYLQLSGERREQHRAELRDQLGLIERSMQSYARRVEELRDDS